MANTERYKGVPQKVAIMGRIIIRDARTREILAEGYNLVTDAGLALIADRMKDNVQAALGWIGVGTSAVTASASDTALGAELDRNAATIVNATLNELFIETDFAESEANGNWKEAGVFNAAAAGVLFNRINIDFNKTAASPVNVQFIFTWTRA